MQQEFQKLRRETTALVSSLAQPSDAASVMSGYPAALQRIVATAQTLTAASGAAIALGNESAMTCIARSGAWAPPLGSRFEPRTGLGGECVRTRDSVICMNAAADPRVDYNACMSLGIRSMVYRPLFDQGKLIGVLAVFSAKPQHFSYRDLTSLRFTDPLVAEALNAEENSVLGAGALVRAALPAPVKTAATTLPEVIESATLARTVTPTFVGRVVDESVADSELPLEFPADLGAETQYDSPLPMLIATLLVVAFISVVAYMSYRSLAKTPIQPAKTAAVTQAPAATGSSPAAQDAAPEGEPSVNASPLYNFPSNVTFRADNSHALLTIALTKPVTYEGYAIKGPSRVYFDLHGVSLAGAEGTTVPVQGSIVSRVRISVFKAGTTRIVFDLNDDKAYQVRVTEPKGALAIEVVELASGDVPENSADVVKSTSSGAKIVNVPKSKP